MLISVDMFGYIGATLTTFAFLPQVILAWRSDNLSGISLPMYLIFVAGTCFWLTFGILAHIGPTIAANTVTIVLSSSVLFLKIRDMRRSKKISEHHDVASGPR
jgi:MtN3 and saliva related transmembrane protein